MNRKISQKLFHSKILLFGEHIINRGAMGLAVPVDHYSGMLKLGNLKDKNVQDSNKALELFANYIIHHDEIATQYDTNLFLEDLDKGLYFDSDIPQGYGLGSSGALVAAVYFRYQLFYKKETPVTIIKNELARLESYFHGKSSGLDALTSYLNKAVLIKKDEVIETFVPAKNVEPRLKIFVVDTQQPRSTATYVNLFLEKCRNKKFGNMLEKSLIPTTDLAIESFRTKKYAELMNSMKLISQIQYDALPEFIPDRFKELWKQGLKNNEYHLKICGAGGGGFIIGFAKEDTKLDLLLGQAKIIELMKF